jgi:hypothetical protein
MSLDDVNAQAENELTSMSINCPSGGSYVMKYAEVVYHQAICPFSFNAAHPDPPHTNLIHFPGGGDGYGWFGFNDSPQQMISPSSCKAQILEFAIPISRKIPEGTSN